jgi:hypothetical protein
MKKIPRDFLVLGWIPTLLVGLGVRTFDAKPANAAERTPVTVTRLFTGPDNKTHAEEITVPLPLAPPNGSSERSQFMSFTNAQWVRTSTSYDLDWHTAPRRQYVVTVSGESEVIIGDGTRIRLYPGKVMLVEDTTGQGHISKAIGDKDRISLFLPLDDKK